MGGGLDIHVTKPTPTLLTLHPPTAQTHGQYPPTPSHPPLSIHTEIFPKPQKVGNCSQPNHLPTYQKANNPPATQVPLPSLTIPVLFPPLRLSAIHPFSSSHPFTSSIPSSSSSVNISHSPHLSHPSIPSNQPQPNLPTPTLMEDTPKKNQVERRCPGRNERWAKSSLF